MPDSRFLVLVPNLGADGADWHVVTNGGRLVTTTERAQVPLGRIEGKRAPLILADDPRDLPTIDLVELLADQLAPNARPATTGE